jgi:glutathione transport system ATP-binding protein
VCSGAELEERVRRLLERVGLHPEAAKKYPHEFSGGQRQRLASRARSRSTPAIIVADEPVSGLDVSVQAQVLNLLIGLQDELGLATSSSRTTSRLSSTSGTGSR